MLGWGRRRVQTAGRSFRLPLLEGSQLLRHAAHATHHCLPVFLPAPCCSQDCGRKMEEFLARCFYQPVRTYRRCCCLFGAGGWGAVAPADLTDSVLLPERELEHALAVGDAHTMGRACFIPLPTRPHIHHTLTRPPD